MAAKIKDGLFIGDVETSQDAEFLELNKISNLINLAGRECPNVWAAHGLVYLTLNWEDRSDFVLFPDRERNDILDDLCEFIDVSLQHGISVLLFSSRGEGRCIIASIAYLMCKYCWGFEKALEFVQSKKPDMNVNKGFMQQLVKLDKHLQKLRVRLYGNLYSEYEDSIKMRLTSWDHSYLKAPHPGSMLSGEDPSRRAQSGRQRRGGVGLYCEIEEENVLINSFVNSKQYLTSLPGPYLNQNWSQKQFKLRFHHQEREFEGDARPIVGKCSSVDSKGEQLSLLKGSRLKKMKEEEEARMKYKNSIEDDQYSVDAEAMDDNADALSDVSDPISPKGNHKGFQNVSQQHAQNMRNQRISAHSNTKYARKDSATLSVDDFAASVVSNSSMASADLYDFVGLGAPPAAGSVSAGGSLSSNTDSIQRNAHRNVSSMEAYQMQHQGQSESRTIPRGQNRSGAEHNYSNSNPQQVVGSGNANRIRPPSPSAQAQRQHTVTTNIAQPKRAVAAPQQTANYVDEKTYYNQAQSASNMHSMHHGSVDAKLGGSNHQPGSGVNLRNSWIDPAPESASGPSRTGNSQSQQQYGDVQDNLTLHDIASMAVDPTPFRTQHVSASQVSGQHPQRGGMDRFQSGGPMRVTRTGGGTGQAAPIQRNMDPRGAGPGGLRASTPTRSVPGRQFGSGPDGHGGGGGNPVPSMIRKNSNQSMEDDGSYGSGSSRMFHQRSVGSTGASTTPRVYRYYHWPCW